MQLHRSQQSCVDLLHMLRWPACSRHAACSNSQAYVFLSTSQQFKEHRKFSPKKKKKKYSLGQWAVTFAWQQQVTAYNGSCQVFPDRLSPAGTSDAVSGIITSRVCFKPKTRKTSTDRTLNSYHKIGDKLKLIYQELVVILLYCPSKIGIITKEPEPLAISA